MTFRESCVILRLRNEFLPREIFRIRMIIVLLEYKREKYFVGNLNSREM